MTHLGYYYKRDDLPVTHKSIGANHSVKTRSGVRLLPLRSTVAAAKRDFLRARVMIDSSRPNLAGIGQKGLEVGSRGLGTWIRRVTSARPVYQFCTAGMPWMSLRALHRTTLYARMANLEDERFRSLLEISQIGI
jgi:hypothetical protein